MKTPLISPPPCQFFNEKGPQKLARSKKKFYSIRQAEPLVRSWSTVASCECAPYVEGPSIDRHFKDEFNLLIIGLLKTYGPFFFLFFYIAKTASLINETLLWYCTSYSTSPVRKYKIFEQSTNLLRMRPMRAASLST